MTGPEHFREAERLIAQASRIMDGFPGEEYAQTIATAQAHATLALAAATALGHGPALADSELVAWHDAASTRKRPTSPGESA